MCFYPLREQIYVKIRGVGNIQTAYVADFIELHNLTKNKYENNN